MDKLIQDIEHLQEMTEQLFNNGIEMRQLKVPQNSQINQPIDRLNGLLVLKTTMNAGSVFDPHFHESIEHLICYRGKFKLYRQILGLFYWPKIIRPGRGARIKSNVGHYAETLDDTELIAVLMVIPKAKNGRMAQMG